MSRADRTDGAPVECPSCGASLPPDGRCPACAPTISAPAPDERPKEFTGPRRIAGYGIVRELGAGGSATVFEAYDDKMKRRVALKVLSRHQSPSERSARRFALEAWIGGKLDHPNLVKAYDRGEWEELSWISMELLDGGSLNDVLGNMRRWGRDERWNLKFGTREYLHWGIGHIIAAARGLDHAHRKGVVHRDVKPMNLLLSRDLGTVKVADFGLARDEEMGRITTTGKLMGTLAYMAPEQIRGLADQVGPATDVYALGVTLFEMVTLRLPYRGQTQELYLNAVLTSEAQRAGRLNALVGRDLETVIGKALEKDPRDRYATAAALAEDLENVLNLRPIVARPTGRLARTAKWVRRKPIHAAFVASLLVAVPAVAFLGAREAQTRSAARAARLDELIQKARWLEERGRLEERLEAAREILALDPDNAQGLRHAALSRYLLSRAAAAAGDMAAAAALGESSLADSARLVQVAGERSWPHAVRAVILEGLGRKAEAEVERAAGAGLRSGEPDAEELEIEALLAMDQSDHARALALLDRLVAREPDRASAVATRGAAFEFLGERDRAIVEYRLALGINPVLYEPRVDLARLAVEKGDLDEAGSYLERAISLRPGDWRAHSVLAQQRVEAGNARLAAGDRAAAARLFDEAERAASRAAELDPDRPEIYVNLGMALMGSRRSLDAPAPDLADRALAAYERALSRWQRPPSGADFRVYLAALSNTCDALIEQRRLDEALGPCGRAAELQPAAPLPFYNLAGIHALSGNREKAIAYLQKDLDLGDTEWQWLEQDPWFESLRGDPRFGRILAAMKAAAETGAARGGGGSRLEAAP